MRHAADALISIDAQHRILSMNPVAEALTGLPEAEAVGRPCSEVLRTSICGDGCPFERVFEREERVTSFDARLRSPSGEAVPVCINTSVLKNAAGEKIGLVESIRDIRHVLSLMAEREAAVARAQKLARWMEAVVASIGDGVITTDLDGRITSLNRAAELITGYQSQEAAGRVCKELFQADFCPLEITLKEGRALPASELYIRAKDGALVPVLVSTEPLRDSQDRLMGAVEILRDRREVRRLQEQFRESRGLDRLIGRSAPMQAVYRLVERLAASDATVLILGESGAGKELVAEILHSRSRRWNQPLVKVNCAALPESLLESELFGHVRGAFTGAVADRVGRFEMAHGGTIFLDEVGDLPLPLQVKLLRVLQERQFERVGGSRTISVDVRVLAATHRNLHAMVEQGLFRQDLFYRLHVVPLELPPLREHPEDIPLLVENFLRRWSDRTERPPKHLTPSAFKLLADYSWPGNVRELENALEYAAVTSADDWLRPEDLPPRLRAAARPAGGRLDAALAAAEREALLAAFESASTSQEAARRLGIGRATLWRKIKRYGISFPRR